MRRRFWTTLFAVIVLPAVVAYAYYKLSSTGYAIGLAKKGRVLTDSGQPVAGAWVIAQWVGYAQGFHGGPNKTVHAGVAVKTDAHGRYSLPAEWRKLQYPLNNFLHTTGNYAFGLLVFAPGLELDATKSPPCTKIGSLPPPFLCPESRSAVVDGSPGDALDDLWLKSANTPLPERARAFAKWNNAAFIDTQAAPDLAWHGAAREATAASQRQELADLTCAVSGELPYEVFFDITSTVAGSAAAIRFKSNVLGSDKVSPEGVDLSCRDTIDRCPPVAPDKVCTALKEITPEKTDATKESTP